MKIGIFFFDLYKYIFKNDKIVIGDIMYVFLILVLE